MIYTVGKDGYLENYALIGNIIGGKEVDVPVDFKFDQFDCYREVDGHLVFDVEKLQTKLNPSELPQLPTPEERIEELENLMNLMLMGVI